MTPAARRTLRLSCHRVLRLGLYAALSDFLPVEPVLAYHLAARCRHRIWTPWVTLWALIHATLAGASDARCAQQAATWLGRPVAPRSGSLAKARARLPVTLVSELTRAVGSACLSRGRPKLILDPTCLVLSDTPANQARFPQPSAQAPGCGFPVLKALVVLDARSGAVLDWVVGSLDDQDLPLSRPLWDRLPRGAIVIADRAFSSYTFYAALAARGVEVIVRQHRNRANRRPGTAGDWTETWTPSGHTQPWWQVDLPPTLTVRIIWHRLPSGGWLKLNTSLPRRDWSARQVAEAYRWRWRIETWFAALKIDLGVEPLAAVRPALAELKLVAAFLALNLVARARLAASRQRRRPPQGVSLGSLVGALVASLGWPWRSARAARAWVLSETAANPHRPGRHEPRVRKRRPKQYRLMTYPRHAYRDRVALGRD